MKKRDRYLELVDQIKRHNWLYYQRNEAEISDHEYDALMAELLALEASGDVEVRADSPTQYVGAGIKEWSFPEVKHIVPMLSLANVYSDEELNKWLQNRCQLPEGWIYEWKVDGISVELVYEHGELIRASTRGDGVVGDDITPHVMHVRGIPRSLPMPADLAVRGEIYMTHETMAAINKATEEAQSKERIYRHPRNAAGGLLRQKDPTVLKTRPLNCMVYEMISGDQKTDLHSVNMAILENLGFVTCSVARTSDAPPSVFGTREIRSSLKFPVDGVVVKLNNIPLRAELGEGNHHPNWAVAYKFPPEEGIGTVKEIVHSIGRTGNLTPVAVFDKPIVLDNTLVERASIHNYDYMQEKNIGVGAVVSVKKAAEIIPQITTVITEGQPGELPAYCPECNTPIARKVNKDGSESRIMTCTNLRCPGRIRRTAEWYVSRDCMDIESVGPAALEVIIPVLEQKLGRKFHLDSLYRLEAGDLAGLEGFGDTSVDNIISAITASITNRTMENFVLGLGIPGVGKEGVRELVKTYPTIEKFRDGLHDLAAKYPYIKEFLKEIHELASVVKPAPVVQESVKLTGMNIVLTGTLSKNRSEIEDLIVRNGGKVGNTINKNTHYLVRGDGGGSKYTKAVELNAAGKANIAILSEEEFLSLLA